MPAKNNANTFPRVAPRIAPLAGAVTLALTLLSTWSTAHAVGLGELDVRSYLGEPLNLRIGVIAQAGEQLDAACFAVISPASSEPAIVRKDVRISLVDNRASRYLQLTGSGAYNEPIARLSVRAACQGESGVVRDYAILLDPAPILKATAGKVVVDTTAPAATANSFQPLGADTRARDAAGATNGSTGTWTIYAGDTLNSIARGIHPNSRSRRSQYIASLRALNPELAGISDSTPLFPNGQLALPDLKALSGTAPTRQAAPAVSRTTEPETSEPEKISRAERRRLAREARAAAADETPRRATPQPTRAPPRDLPVATGSSAQSESAAKKTTASTATKQPGFSLKISGGDIDVSRSKGVSEEVRAQLRERQSLLDSDDQVAQMLALKNNVKQIEKRLNDLQLKLSTVPGLLPADTRTAPATTTTPAVTAAPATTVAPPPKTAEAPVTPTVTAPVVTPAVTATATPNATPPATPDTTTTPVAPVEKAAQTPPAATKPAPKVIETAKPVTQAEEGLFGIPFAWLAGGGALLAAALAWFFVRKKNEPPSLFNGPRIETPAAPRDEFNKWADEPDTVWLEENQGTNKPSSAPSQGSNATTDSAARNAAGEAEAARSAALLMGAGRAQAPNKASATAQEAINILLTPAAPKAVRPEAAAAIDVNSPLDLSLDDDMELPALDMSTGRIVEIPELREGQTADDRLQRLRYIEERLPELASKTVSVDEPDTVINAARSYFEEDQQARACELLIFATEERPQEIRYWLAQFEIYRVEKLAKPYSELAAKFNKLFGHTHVWNKVRHVGHQLDPANTLFAAAGNAPDGEHFNPLAENWLNAPNASISNALAADLRRSLFEENEVSATDFMSVTQRIAVMR
jgi:hypothetical protein